jgi:hypothetical protein
MSNPHSLKWMIARWRARAAGVIAAEPEGSRRAAIAREIDFEAAGLTAELGRGNAAAAAWRALRLGQHLAQADGQIARSDGGAGKASEQRSKVAAQHAAWRAEASEIWARHPRWTAFDIARRIDPARANYIRQVIARNPL